MNARRRSIPTSELTMNVFGVERARQATTVGLGLVFAIILGIVLIVGSRLATRVTVDVAALQTASELEAYPSMLDEQLSALRNRLEERTYAAQALANLKTTSASFDHDLARLRTAHLGDSLELTDAVQLWQQYGPVIDPVISFHGEPYVDTDSGSSLSPQGRTHYDNVRRAQLFARQNSEQLHALVAALATGLQSQATREARRLRLLLSGGVLAAVLLGLAAAYLQVTR
ncbi:MAG: hypothetical protein ACREU3_18665, partial [Steroidobacteraceae bacterium]